MERPGAPDPNDVAGRAPRPRAAGGGRLPSFARADAWGRIALRGERIRAFFGDALRRDLDRGRGFPWLVVAFGLGIVGYFALPREPWLPALVALAAGLGWIAVAARRGGRDAIVATLAAAAACGLLAAKLETDRMAAPRLDRERTVTVSGWVEEAEDTADGGTRMVLRVAAMEAWGRALERPPDRIAVTVAKGRDAAVRIGSGARFAARLRPPDGPVMPGGYDFARRAYFEGRGASGFVLGRVAAVDLGEAPTGLAIRAAIADLRHAIADRIRAALPGASGTIAAALVVGEARAIPQGVNEAMRASGLTHIISISGLHMSLVGGGVFVATRMALALFPGLALRFAAKKIAAISAFAAISAYLLISGGGVATNRSYVMFAIGLFAILADRPAISLRTVALSAIVILILQPHAVTEPSFLMSFLAVIALVSAYEAWRRRPVAADEPERTRDGRLGRWFAGAGRYVAGLAFTSLVAGLATAPVVADAFHRAAPYGLVANMVVMPVVGLLVMPMAVVTMLAMPFGLEAVPLAGMGAGIDFMIAVARAVAGWPGGEGLIGRPHPGSLPLAVAGILWLTLWQGRWRLLGLAPLAVALFLAPHAKTPDVLIASQGTPIAVRGDDGRLAVLDPARARFAVSNWLAADADDRDPRDTAAEGSTGPGWRCDDLGCVIRGGGWAGRAPTAEPAGTGTRAPRIVAFVRDPRAFDEDCRIADLVVTRLDAPAGCADHTTVIDRAALARLGATAVYWPPAPAGPGTSDPATSDPGPADGRRGRTPDRHGRAIPRTPPTIVGALPPGRRPWMPAHEEPATAAKSAAGGPANPNRRAADEKSDD